MCILVTGSSGLLGATIAEQLAAHSARSPFLKDDLSLLLCDAAQVLQKRVPHIVETFAQHKWKLPTTVDRVYVIEKAERLLHYQSIYNFNEYMQELA